MSVKQKSYLKIAAFGGFRTIPPIAGAAGADKFAVELYPRITRLGHSITAYCRIYPGQNIDQIPEFENIKLIYLKTVKNAGFDSLLHSFKSTISIILKNEADVVHIQSGANSIWALLLRLAGKKVVVSQFAMDWKRDKWPWYGKLFYQISNYLTAYVPNRVVFDNIYTKEYFEKKFKKKFDFVPYGCEVPEPPNNTDILKKMGIEKGEYFLFIGRFIPDKGLHILTKAFQNLITNKKLVLIGGSPNPSDYEKEIRNTIDKRIIFPGYIYGDDANILISNSFAYIQPSLIEGLSPVILTVMGLGTPLICSDIIENKFITKENAIHFISGNPDSLKEKIEYTLTNTSDINLRAASGQIDVKERFNWDTITDQYIKIFSE